MTQIEIFRAGTHQPMQGAAIHFSQSDLDAIVKAYDPALHEAPLVIGHPVHNGPAHGWVKSLARHGDALVAEVGEIDPAFADLVRGGRYKKVSASFYLKDAPNNPAPGQMGLRHVGFLGAMAPAVKGLRAIDLADNEAGVVSFGETASIVARIFRRLRDSIIAKDGVEAADLIVADWDIEALAQADQPADSPAASAFGDPAIDQNKEEKMGIGTKDDLAGQAAALKSREDELAANNAALDAKQAAFAKKENAARHDENARLIGAMVKEGRVAPALAPGMVAFMDGLDDMSTVSFGEGGEQQTPLGYFRAVLAKAGPVIDFGELAAGDIAPAEFADGEAIGRAAREHIDAQAAKGVHVGPEAAVAHVKKGQVK
ncbi:MAG: peptidase [Alphaproteobacteria bacterium]